MLVGIADYLADSGQGGDLFRGALRVTSGHHNLGIGVVAMDAADRGTCVLVGRGGHGAGIENYNLGVIGRCGAVESLLLELALDGGAVGLGSPASEVLDVETRHSDYGK